jgi:hypothetical protein
MAFNPGPGPPYAGQIYLIGGKKPLPPTYPVPKALPLSQDKANTAYLCIKAVDLNKVPMKGKMPMGDT